MQLIFDSLERQLNVIYQVAGLKEDLNLQGNEFSVLLSMFVTG
jgi:hypothetical protein